MRNKKDITDRPPPPPRPAPARYSSFSFTNYQHMSNLVYIPTDLLLSHIKKTSKLTFLSQIKTPLGMTFILSVLEILQKGKNRKKIRGPSSPVCPVCRNLLLPHVHFLPSLTCSARLVPIRDCIPKPHFPLFPFGIQMFQTRKQRQEIWGWEERGCGNYSFWSHNAGSSLHGSRVVMSPPAPVSIKPLCF